MMEIIPLVFSLSSHMEPKSEEIQEKHKSWDVMPLSHSSLLHQKQGPWNKKLNFLPKNVRKCAWPHNKTTQNSSSDDVDPTGFISMYHMPASFEGTPKIMLDDIDIEIGEMNWNFKSE